MATLKTIISMKSGDRFAMLTSVAPSVTTTAPTGVRKPVSRHAAVTTLIAMTIQVTAVALATYAVVCWISLKLTNARRRNRPTPGQPLGKAENSFCRTTLLQ